MKVVAGDIYSKVRVTYILIDASDTETLEMGVSVQIPEQSRVVERLVLAHCEEP